MLQAPPDKVSRFHNKHFISEGSGGYFGTGDVIGVSVVFKIKIETLLREKTW